MPSNVNSMAQEMCELAGFGVPNFVTCHNGQKFTCSCQIGEVEFMGIDADFSEAFAQMYLAVAGHTLISADNAEQTVFGFRDMFSEMGATPSLHMEEQLEYLKTRDDHCLFCGAWWEDGHEEGCAVFGTEESHRE